MVDLDHFLGQFPLCLMDSGGTADARKDSYAKVFGAQILTPIFQSDFKLISYTGVELFIRSKV